MLTGDDNKDQQNIYPESQPSDYNGKLCNIGEGSECLIVSVMSLQSSTKARGVLNLFRTVLVCLILLLSSIYFSKDANEIILQPIEKMIDKVSKIAKNPIKAIQDEENEAMMMQQLLEKARHEGNTDLLELQTKKESGATPMETQILEDTIMKIGALLALGFGEAGSEIIAANIQKGGDVNPMIGGKKSHSYIRILLCTPLCRYNRSITGRNNGVGKHSCRNGTLYCGSILWQCKQKHRRCFPVGMEVP